MNQNDVIARVETAIQRIQQGKTVILVDDEDRENEGDLVVAAETCTPELINFMVTECRGLVCLAMSSDQIDRLQLPMMVSSNRSPYGTAFTISIEARTGVTTGISAKDRARTIQVAADPASGPNDLVSPGHVFPLRAADGGVLVRTGQTEGSVDLARFAGLSPSAVICEIMNEDGSMARMPELETFAKKHDTMILSIADLIQYRLSRESLVRCIRSEPLHTQWPGDWKVMVFQDTITEVEHLAFVCGEPTPDKPSLVRVQHQQDDFGAFLTPSPLTGIDFIRSSMQAIGEFGCGVVVYLDRQSYSATTLLQRYLSHEHMPQGSFHEELEDQQEPLRQLGIGSQILKQVGVGSMIVLTNRPKAIIGSEAYGLNVTEQRHLPEYRLLSTAKAAPGEVD